MNYLVVKENTKRKMKKNIKLSGYSIKPRIKIRKDFIEVKEIDILDNRLKESMLKKQFSVAFKRMLKIIMSLLESEEVSSGDAKIAFTELERMKRILKEKYKKEIKAKEYSKMWKKVEILEKELEEKMIIQQRRNEMFYQMMMRNNQELEEQKGRGR